MPGRNAFRDFLRPGGGWTGDGPGQYPSNLDINDYLANIAPTYEQSREANVLSGMGDRADAAFARQREQQQAEEDARQVGFQSVADEGDYTRGMEERKLEMPLRVAESKAAAEADAMRQFLGMAAATGGNRSMSMSGVGTIGAPPRPSTAPVVSDRLLADVGKARLAAEKRPTSGGWFGTSMGAGPSPEQGAFEQAQSSASSRLNPEIVGLARKIMADFPDATAGDGAAQLGETALTPEEQQELGYALTILRGF